MTDTAALVRAAKHRLRSTIRSYLTTTMAPNPTLRDTKSLAITKHLTAHPLFMSSQSISIFLSMAHEVNTHYLVQAAFDAGKRVYVPCMVPCTSQLDGPPIPPPSVPSANNTAAAAPIKNKNKTKKRTKLVMVPLRDAQDYASLPLDKWGIPTPADPDARQPWGSNADAAAAPVDLVIVPGVAFDLANGGRCGYGRGFYDDWFSRHGGTARRCAVAFDAQVLDYKVTTSPGGLNGEERGELDDVKAELGFKVPIEAHDERVQWVVTESGGVMECASKQP